jgi:uncharacterized protein YbjT (DUF2867 family)
VVIAGATGFVGERLVRRLEGTSWTTRCGTRRPERVRDRWPDRTWVALDVDDAATLGPAFAGADALVYLVHQMGAEVRDLVAHERAAARRVVDAAHAAGVGRIVYLGGYQPTSGSAVSEHLEARRVTGEVLRAGPVPTLELRASMIVGEGSESWRIVRDLAARLPAMILPRWLSSRTEPIAIDDVVEALALALDVPLTQSACYDLPGPEALSCEQILVRTAATFGVRPLRVRIPLLTPSVSSHWIRWVTRADYTVARHLVDGLAADLVSTGPSFWTLVPDHQPLSFDEAVARARRDEPPLEWPGRTWESVVRRVSLAP